MDTSREDACEFNGLQSNKLRQVSRARKSLSVDRMRSPHSDLNRWLSKVDVVKSVSGVRRSTSDLSLTSYEPQSHISFLTNTYPLRSAPLQLQADLEQPDNSAPNNQTGYDTVLKSKRGLNFNRKARLIGKNGDCHVNRRHINFLTRSCISDVFSSLVDMKWRYSILLFFMSYVASWIVFACIWWLVAVTHDDTSHSADDSSWTSCVNHVTNFKSALLFSVETQHTIGYGYRYIETECPWAFIILMLQCSTGVLLQSLSFGLLFVKFSRPKRRKHTLIFSRSAVVALQDNRYRLIFRVAHTRRSYIINTSIKMYLIENKLTVEGEAVKHCYCPLRLSTSSSDNDQFALLAAWPVNVVHTIDADSPLWHISASQLPNQRFEIIVILEGNVESTGMTMQVRTSYLPSEIIWGHRLYPLSATLSTDGKYTVDYTHFNDVISIVMPHCSAKDHHERLVSPAQDVVKVDYALKTNSSSRHLAEIRQHRMDTIRRDKITKL